MTAKPDECKSIEKLIHLSIDDGLDGAGKRRLEEHLTSCERCARKLAALLATEERARRFNSVEPPPEYWNTFSGRVIERIESGAGKKPARDLLRALTDLFAAPRPRLRLAAGVAALAVVVVAGAMYLRESRRIAPSEPVRHEAETAREKAAVKTAEPAERKVEAKDGTQTADEAAAPRPKAKSPAMAPAERERADAAAASPGAAGSTTAAVAPAVAPSAEPAASAGADKLAEAGKSVEADKPSEADKSAALAMLPAAQPARVESLDAARSLAAGKFTDRAAPADTGESAAHARLLNRAARSFPESKGELSMTALGARGGAPADATTERYVLDGVTVPRVSPADTSMSVAGLRNVIRTWRRHIESHPLDAANERGYLQVATAYELLARRTRDEAVISEGIRIVDGYALLTADTGLKALLLEARARIESFRDK